MSSCSDAMLEAKLAVMDAFERVSNHVGRAPRHPQWLQNTTLYCLSSGTRAQKLSTFALNGM